MNFKQIPILILSRDRLSCLKQQIEALHSRGYENIIIVDNQTTYAPLLEYYKTLPHEIIYLGGNFGHTAIIEQGIVNRFNSDYYVYTDPDIVPCEECPDDFMEHFYNILQKYPGCLKAGFGLRTNDLPEHYHRKDEVMGWESQYWTKPLEPGIFYAPIDTTFALCRPGRKDIWAMAGRTGKPYWARHTTWYLDFNNLAEDERYYLERARGGECHWSQLNR